MQTVVITFLDFRLLSQYWFLFPSYISYNKLKKVISNLWKYVKSWNIFMRIFLHNIKSLGDDFIVVIFGSDFQWSEWAKKEYL